MRTLTLLLACLGLPFTSPAGTAEGKTTAERLVWSTLPALPDANGVAGPFAGVADGHLLVAGGANFPDKKPWEGGVKVWHDTVYALSATNGTWRVAGRLPAPAGYGVSITTPQGLLCIGGGTTNRHFREVFRLNLAADGSLTRTDLPPLPIPLADAGGALLKNTVHVAGGAEAPGEQAASNRLFTLDLTKLDAGWVEREPLPGPARIQPLAAAQGGSFFLCGGASLEPVDGKVKRVYRRDAWRYTPGQGWKAIADLPHPLAAAPTPAPAIGVAHFLALGGNDGSQAGFQPVSAHPGFNRDVLAYHTVTDTWTPFGTLPGPARVTTTPVLWDKTWVLPTGEVRPGVRSPETGAFTVSATRKPFGFWNYAVFGLYPLLMIGIAWMVGRKGSSDEFFRGGQHLPWWAVGLSIYATMLSSITFMAIPARAFATDWAYIVGILSLPLLAPVIIRFYLPFFRQLNVTSAYEYLERRFNLGLRWFGSVSFIILQLGRTAIVLYLPALALSTVSQFDMTACILLMGAISILMTFQGGLESVVWTDVAQTVILLVGALAMLALAVSGVPDGAAGVLRIAAADAKVFGGLDFTWNAAAAGVWVILLGNILNSLASYTTGQDVVQRFVSTRDERQAARSVWTNALMSLPSQVIFFSVGTALYAFYKSHPGRLDPTLEKGDAVFSLFIVNEMPAGLAGLVVAAIFAAAQPTSSLNSIATVWVQDFVARLRPATPDAARLAHARDATVLSGVAGTLVAVAMTRYQIYSTWDLFLQLVGLTGSALAGVFILGIFTTRATGAGTVAGALASVAFMAWMRSHGTWHFFVTGVAGLALCVGVGYLASLVLPSRSRNLAGLTLHTRAPAKPD